MFTKQLKGRARYLMWIWEAKMVWNYWKTVINDVSHEAWSNWVLIWALNDFQRNLAAF